METLLKTEINFEPYHEDNEVSHPLEDLSFEEIEHHMLDIGITYPGYDDYRYDKKTKSLRYGNSMGWYDLIGIKF